MAGIFLKALVRLAYDTLGLQTYFTSGPTETKAWTIIKGMTAPQVGRSNIISYRILCIDKYVYKYMNIVYEYILFSTLSDNRLLG